MTLDYESYMKPHNDLVIKAIQNGDYVDGLIWRTFLDTCDAIQIIAAEFGDITEDNFERNEIDKFYMFNLYGTNYIILSHILMNPSHDESFSTQIAYPVEKIKETKIVENWEIISKGDIF